MIKRVFTILIFSIVAISFTSVAYGEESKSKDCSCPKVTCGPCQKKVLTGKVVRFCDWGDINVCRKVVCENVNYYFGCLSKKSEEKKKRAQEEEDAKKDLVLVYEEKQKKSKKRKKKKRVISSVKEKFGPKRSDKVELKTEGLIEVTNDSRVLPGTVYSEVVVGKVQKAQEKIIHLHRGKTMFLEKGDDLYVGDEIRNKTKKKLNITLQFKNGVVKLKLAPKSKLLVQDPHSIVGRFQPFLYLVYGGLKVDSQMKEGSFDLLAGQILVRSKNANAEIGYEMENGHLKVKVESLKGQVEVVKAQDLSGKSITVQQGNFVSWMSETLAHLFTADEKAALAGEGFITPVFEMNEKRKARLGLLEKKEEPSLFADWSKKTKTKGRSVASMDSGICQAPQAEYQQCAWTCEGNGKKAKDCQAQKSNVHCVRRICNAAGEWGVATPFASSYKDLCPAQGTRVGECSP